MQQVQVTLQQSLDNKKGKLDSAQLSNSLW